MVNSPKSPNSEKAANRKAKVEARQLEKVEKQAGTEKSQENEDKEKAAQAKQELEQKERENREQKEIEVRKRRLEMTSALDKLIPSRFEAGSDIMTVGERWTTFLELFTEWVVVTKRTDKTENFQVFKILMGDEARRIVRNSPTEKTSDLTKLQELLSGHFVKKRAIWTERVLFRQISREEGETLEDLAYRLQTAGKRCKFNEYSLDVAVTEQLIISSNIPEMKRKILQDEKEEYKVIDIISLGQRFEKAREECEILSSNVSRTKGSVLYNSPHPKTDNASPSFSNKGNHNSSECGKCGRKSHVNTEDCPAIGRECGQCGKLGHFRKVCRSGPKDGRRENYNKYNNDTSSYTSNGNSNNASYDDNSNKTKSFDNRHNASRTNSFDINSNKTNSFDNRNNASYNDNSNKTKSFDNRHNASSRTNAISEEVWLSPSEYDNFAKYQAWERELEDDGDESDIYTIRPKHIDKRRGPRAEVQVNGSVLDMLIDTGSPINVIDEVSLSKLGYAPQLEPCVSAYYGFKATEPIQTLGQFYADICTDTGDKSAVFIVVRGESENLLGYQTASKLGVIKFKSGYYQQRDPTDVNQHEAPIPKIEPAIETAKHLKAYDRRRLDDPSIWIQPRSTDKGFF